MATKAEATDEKGNLKPGFTVTTVDGKKRYNKNESFISLVRGAVRSLSPDIKDRRERIEDAVDGGIEEANKANKPTIGKKAAAEIAAKRTARRTKREKEEAARRRAK